jgi:hypothetical protein
MLKKMFAAFRPDPIKAQVQETIDRDLRIANTLESMIVSGRYDGSFMCPTMYRAVHDGVLTEPERFEAVQFIESAMYPNGTMACQVLDQRHSDEWIQEELPKTMRLGSQMSFERRIIMSNHYWGLIRHLRNNARLNKMIYID